MKIAKKALSVFLAMLMLFSACSVSLTGITASAAEGDSKYEKATVIELINTAIADGYANQSSGNATNISGDDGSVLAAAEAIFDYAVKTYREGRKADSGYNSGDTLLAKFIADFSGSFSGTALNSMKALATDVLNPAGTTLYGYENKLSSGPHTIQNESNTGYWQTVELVASQGDDWTSNTADSYYNSAVSRDNVTKTVAIELDLEEYLLGFESISDVPASIITSVSYSYVHTTNKVSTVTYAKVTTSSASWGRTKYTATTQITTNIWNYMSAKPVRTVIKDKTTKKQLAAYDKYFTPERLATTLEELLQMSLVDLEYQYTLASGYRDAIINDFTKNIIEHFFGEGSYQKILDYVTNLEFAYRVVAGMNAIDNLNQYIGTEYNKDSYDEMASLYTKVNSAYNVVTNMQSDVLKYILDEYDYEDEYENIDLAKAKTYIDKLYDIMTEQRLEELVASMTATYNKYYSLLDKENIEEPTDEEISNLVNQVSAYNSILAQYTGYSYYRTYYTTAHESAWNDFCTKLNEVAEVRGIKEDYNNLYKFFYPLLFTTAIVDLDDDGAMELYEDIETRLAELKENYNEIVAKYGNETIAKNIYTLEYEGTSDLLQNIVENSKTTGLKAVKDNLVDRAEADLDESMAFADVTVVNFENFATIKSALSGYNYDLYDYVTGGNRDGENWLSSEYQSKYSQVQALLDKYHAFSTTDGKSFFNEAFTFDTDGDGIWATRYAGDQTVEVTDEETGDVGYDQIGYPTDIARDNEDNNGDGAADDNYYVDEKVLLSTVTRIDNFITSRDFGALVGFVDEDTEEATDLKTYVNQMLNESVFTSDLLNTLVAAIYPMICDLLETELPKALADLGTPNDPGASAAIDVSTLTSALDGTLNIYIDDDEKTSAVDDNYLGRNQRYLYEVFESADLYIYPCSFAKYLNIVNPAIFKAGNALYDDLIKAGRDWNYFALAEDLKDEDGEVIAEAGTIHIDYDWGINGDRDSFLESIAYIFDSILPLLQVIMNGTTFYEELERAAYVWGKVDITILKNQQLGGYGRLLLTLTCLDSDGNPYPVWNSVIVPLFRVLGIEDIPTLKANFTGDELAEILLGTLLDRVDEILDAPLESILTILPNLVYWLSMDSVQEILDNINININLGIGVDIESGDSGAIGDIVGWLGNDVFDFLDNLTSFDLGLAVSDMLDLYDLLGFEITNFNEVLEFALGALNLGIELPELKQQEIIFCSNWTNRADGSVNLVANKGDLMYWFLDYLVSAIADGTLINSLLGEKEMDPTLKSVIDKLVTQVSGNPDGALAAVIELLNPVEYDLQEMEWIEQGDWNYGDIEGANQMSIVYLNYGNDWTREDANYLVDNIDSILAAILDLANVDIDDLGAYLQEKLNSLFTNENITAIVKMLGGLGDSAIAVIEDLVKNQIGIDLDSWFVAYGYLFPADTWKEDAEVILPTSQFYANNFGVEGIANADGTISWFFNKMPLVDGDGYTFINILSRLLGGASILVEFLFAGEDVKAFEDLLTIKGYETYDTSLGLLLTMLGVENLPTQADFVEAPMGSFTNMLTATLDWFYTLTNSDNMIAQLLELIPDVFYFIESNGLSTMLHNLLMPVLVLVDTVRPLFDVNINGVLSYIVSDFLNYGNIDLDGLLQYVIDGINVHFSDLDYVWYSVDINNLKMSEIIKILDMYMGTNLYESGLVQIGIKGLCSGVEKVENTSVGTIYRTTVTAADSITIIITAILDCLSYETAGGKANGDAICEFIAEMTGNEDIATLYPAIQDIINGIVYEYDSPNWGYMFESGDIFSLTLPKQTIVYLGYTTDWDKETADTVYGALDDVLDLVLPEVLDEGETIATLLNGLLEDEVYTDEILNTVVELLVNLLADFDETLRDLVDCVVDTDISAWFKFCTYDETAGEYVCTYDWGVDEAAEAEKKDKFIDGIQEVLAPANELLSWLFFGTDYAFFTSSEVDENGNYTYADLLTLNGGEGYAYGLVPIFEALGCEMQPASTFYDAEKGTYDVGKAVESILDSALALVDKVSANPVEEAFKLIPNLIYFVNADGLVTSVNNLLAPVNGIIEKLSPVIGEVSIGALLKDTIGFDICNITMETLLGIAVDNDVVISDKMIVILSDLYVGKLAEFTSANGRTAYRLDVTGYEGDVLTLILSIALDLFNLNPDLFSELLGEDVYWTVFNLIKGASEAFTYRDMNWGYMYKGETNADKLAALEAADGVLPERTNTAYDVYTLYQNNWNESTAEYVTTVLDTLVHDITTAVRSDGSSLGMILDQAIADGLYQDSLANDLIEMVVELLVDYAGIVEGAGALLGAESIVKWFDYCTITTDENGETVVTCDHNWGIDEAETIDEKRTAFVNAFATILEPAYELLAWLFFAEDYTFFDGTTGDPLITIKGGRGYDEALVPLFEAVGVLMKRDANGELLSVEDTYLKGESAVLPASAFYVDSKLDMELAVKTIFYAVSDWLYDICGDLSDQSGDGALTSMLERLPNFIYAINADGLKVVVNNLVAPVMFLLETLEPMIGEIDFNELIGIEGMDIFDFDFDDLFALLEDLLGLYFPDYTQEFLKTFYIGQLVDYTSANGETAYFMTYTDEEAEHDMITCLIGFVVDAFQDPRNPECLIDWMGEDIYNGIMAILGLNGVKDMQDFSWLYTDKADTDYEFNATETSVRYSAAYNNIWTRDKAEYIADNLPDFVSDILGLIGLEINGVEIKSVDDLLDSLLEGNLYTQATIDSLLETVRDLVSNLTSLEPYGEYIVGVLDRAFGVNLAAWDTMELKVVDGDRDSFVAALEEMLAPIVPLLDVLLCGENIELFYTIEPENVGKSAITIYGSEGYAYGIVPLFEALGCTMMAPEEFKKLSNEDKVGALLDSLLDRVDVILTDPVNELFAMIPELVYFINSDGLATCVNNILNSVDTVLIALEPIVGATSLMELLGVDLAEFDFEYIINMACEAIEESTGLDVEPLIIDFVAELTVGKVVSYTSANGETYYKMVYAGENQFADMITVLLRLIIDFLATGNNADAIIALISKNSESDDAANSASTLIHFVLTALNTEPMTSGAMATLYYIFYGLEHGADGLDYLYGNYGESWDSLVDFFENSEDSTVNKAANVLKAILKEFAGIDTDSSVDNCDCNCHSNSAFIRFFFKIANFFRRIFGMTQYRYCDCGAAHW